MKGKQGGRHHRTGKLFTLILTIVFASSLFPVMKLKAIDANTNTLTIDLSYDDKPIDGAELEIIQVGEVKEDESRNITFKPVESYKDSIKDGFDTENMSAEKLLKLAQTLSASITQQDVKASEVTSQNGTAVFIGLSSGIYLVRQTGSIENSTAAGYKVMAPFLITVTDNAVARPKTSPVQTSHSPSPSPHSTPTPAPSITPSPQPTPTAATTPAPKQELPETGNTSPEEKKTSSTPETGVSGTTAYWLACASGAVIMAGIIIMACMRKEG
jgi:cell division septation protein DedD